ALSEIAATTGCSAAMASRFFLARTASAKFRKDDVIAAAPVEVASAETAEEDGDRIIVPSKEAVAAAELPTLLALDDAGSRK
ncbi:hypothetical protein ACC809_37080, partial [Rhizobium johnstonii]